MIENKDELLANLRRAKALITHQWTAFGMDHNGGPESDCPACVAADDLSFHDAVDDVLISLGWAIDLLTRGPGLLGEDLKTSYMTCRRCGTSSALFRVETEGNDGLGSRTPLAPVNFQCVSCGETYGLALTMQLKAG